MHPCRGINRFCWKETIELIRSPLIRFIQQKRPPEGGLTMGYMECNYRLITRADLRKPAASARAM